MQEPNIPQMIVVNQSRQILKSFGLNALKQKFYKFDQAPAQDSPDKTSMLGTPIFDSLTFYGSGPDGAVTYYDLNLKKTVTVPKLTIDIALITVNENILVSKTKVAGANGSVKQWINIDDYEIEIRGVFTSEIPDTRPDELIRNLHKITKSTSEVSVASGFLNLFGITSVVFEGRQIFPQDESQRDVLKFSLNCLSETPFAVKVIQQGSTTSSNDSLAIANRRFF